MWLLYCDEGNDRLKLASSAGFAILSEDQQFCERILKELSNWPELFKNLAMAENAEVQRRCLIGIANMVEFGGEAVASQIMAVSANNNQKNIFKFLCRAKYSAFWLPLRSWATMIAKPLRRKRKGLWTRPRSKA